MAYRSENDKFSLKTNYTDLNLTLYPNTVDTRLNNTNMRGFVNIGDGALPDYVMAEYMNAAIDGVMALERALGATPMVPYGTAPENFNAAVEGGTVASRLSRIENGLFDVRYGGNGWNGNASTRPTLSTHNHDGLNGHPGKISLTTEIEGLLQKVNLNLSSETGVTGADVYVSKTNPVLISTALADTLSLTLGGTVSGETTFKKGFSSRTRLDVAADELTVGSGASLATDTSASVGKALSATSAGTVVTLATLPAAEKNHLLYGRYVLAARIKTTASAAGSLIRFQVGATVVDVAGTYFTPNQYKQVFFVFEQNSTTKAADLTIQKLATAASATVSFDSLFIEPIHPAVLDR